MIEEDLRQVEGEQQRVRDNLEAVPENSDMHRSYLSMLAEQEGRIAGLTKRRQEARDAARSNSEKVEDIIRTF